jgi:hypothetical protein
LRRKRDREAMNRKIDLTVGARQYHRKNKMAIDCAQSSYGRSRCQSRFHGDRDRFVEFAAAELEDR